MNLRRIDEIVATVNSLANPSSITVGEPKLTEQAVAEYLRYGLCLLTDSGVDGPGETQPVHVGRLLARVRKQLGPLLPEGGSDPLIDLVQASSKAPLEKDLYHQVLDKLELIREVQKLGRGYYLPTPLRLVELTSGDLLVIGGLPTAEAQKTLKVKLETAGLARVARISALSPAQLNDSSVRQSLSNWLGNELGLMPWTTSYLKAATKDLKPSASDMGEFQVYFPEAYPAKPQYFRWCDGKDWAGRPDQLYLCRAKAKNGPAPYWLGLLARGNEEVRLVKEAELVSRDDVPRLLYGLDLIAKSPIKATVEVGAADTHLKLVSWLPDQELRLMLALATDVSAAPDKLPRLFRFENRWRGEIEGTLRGLGIEFRSESSPRS